MFDVSPEMKDRISMAAALYSSPAADRRVLERTASQFVGDVGVLTDDALRDRILIGTYGPGSVHGLSAEAVIAVAWHNH